MVEFKKNFAFFLFVIIYSSLIYGESQIDIFKVQKVFEFPEIIEPRCVAEYDGKYYITDHSTHRIIIVNKERNKVVGYIGKPGQGAGELFRPTYIFIKNRKIYVFDYAHEKGRVQIFSTDGKFLGQIPLSFEPWMGFSVNSKGEILLNQPQKKSIMSVYDENGKFIKSIGKLKQVSEIYGNNFSSLNNTYRFAVNRVYLDVDREDNIYSVFIFAPIIQKYDSNGNLIKEVRIRGKEMEEIVGYFPKTHKPTGLVKTGIDGVLVYYFIKFAIIEPKSNTLWVLTGKDDYFYIYNLNTLEKIDELYLDYSLYKGGIFYLSRGDGELFFSTVLKPGLYKLEMAKNK
jgi:hypothetical protein